MKKTELILLGFMILLSLSVFSQAKDYEFKTRPVGEKLQYEVGSDFQFVSFNIKGIKTSSQKLALVNLLESNSNFKRVRISNSHEFHGFIHKSLKAQDVRGILLAQGFDFKFDKYKFKGNFINEQQLKKALKN